MRSEVEPLLSAHAKAEAFMEVPAAEGLLTPTTLAAEGRLSGARLGSYQLLKEIGRGGMGVVYLAARADFALWKDADPDIPILLDARAEYAKLN